MFCRDAQWCFDAGLVGPKNNAQRKSKKGLG